MNQDAKSNSRNSGSHQFILIDNVPIAEHQDFGTPVTKRDRYILKLISEQLKVHLLVPSRQEINRTSKAIESGFNKKEKDNRGEQRAFFVFT